jgi:DNA-binding XRE family transcriptional regulator
MAVATLMTPFAEWLESEMRTRRVNKSQLAAYIDSRPQTVGAWFTDDRLPSTDLCRRLADYLHEPYEAVLRRAGHLPAGPVEQAPSLPGWLSEVLDQLTERELRAVKASAVALLELREDSK